MRKGMITATCKLCGTDFKAKTYYKYFCSEPCRYEYGSQANRGPKNSPLGSDEIRRLRWFRSDFRDGIIESELIERYGFTDWNFFRRKMSTGDTMEAKRNRGDIVRLFDEKAIPPKLMSVYAYAAMCVAGS